jgi:hypothetical protein
MVNNFDVNEDYYVVYGSGGTQLLHAFIYAYYKLFNKKINIYARSPYYSYYKTYPNMNPTQSIFNQSENMEPSSVLEFVCTPNNPDGNSNSSGFYKGAHHVHDLVYYWPHNFDNSTVVSKPFPSALFSLSKMTGHSSTRLGWALTKVLNLQ